MTGLAREIWYVKFRARTDASVGQLGRRELMLTDVLRSRKDFPLLVVCSGSLDLSVFRLSFAVGAKERVVLCC